MRVHHFSAVTSVIWALSPGTTLAQDQNPSSSNFRRRALGDAAILGDYLYIEGGEISQAGDSRQRDGPFSRPFNVSLSLPLNSAWKTREIEPKVIDRGDKPTVKFGSLWPDEDSDRLYQWDGEGSKGDPQSGRERKLWMMTPDGNGGGEWTSVDGSTEIEDFANINRRAQAATTVCNGTVYSLGGFVSGLTDNRVNTQGRGNVPAINMQKLNMKEGTWDKLPLESMSPPNGVFIRGMATCVEGFGDSSFVFTSGGAISSRASTRDGIRPLDPTNVTFYDTEQDQWLWQKATGNPPSAWRSQHCMVGVKSPSGSYELFVYGGYNDEKDALDDMWVLTIPGFHWMQVATSKTPRAYHSCVVAGKRHMIVNGGIPGSSGEPWAWDEKDEWNYGIGVFDLSKLEWTDEYDPNAGEYATPESVSKWYEDGGMDNLGWSSDAVKGIFGSVNLRFESASEPTQSNSINNDSSSDGSDKSGTPTGAIAGGIVGGVVALGALGAAIFFFLRRRTHRNHTKELAATEVEAPFPKQMTPSSWSTPIDSKTHTPHSELDASPPVELPGNGPYYEMPGSGVEPSELDGSGFQGHAKR